MSPFWMYDESVPTNWWTEVFLEARIIFQEDPPAVPVVSA